MATSVTLPQSFDWSAPFEFFYKFLSFTKQSLYTLKQVRLFCRGIKGSSAIRKRNTFRPDQKYLVPRPYKDNSKRYTSKLPIWLGAAFFLVILVGLLVLTLVSAAPASQTISQNPIIETGTAGTQPAKVVINLPLTSNPKPLTNSLPTSLEQVLKDTSGKWQPKLGSKAEYGLVVHNLDTGEKVSLNGHTNYDTASLYKLFVMLGIYYDISQGNLTLDTPITLSPAADATDEDDYVLLQEGESLPVSTLLKEMITRSNNTAALMLLFQVRTSRLPKIMAELGFKESNFDDSYNYQATPEDLDLFLTRLANRQLLNSSADAAMLTLLEQNVIRDRIPLLLPPGTRVANKPGNLAGITNDSGLVFLPNGQHLAITVMVRNFSDTEASYKFISDLSLAAFNYYAK